MKPGGSLELIFFPNTWNWPFFETDFFFQIPEIGDSLILSINGNREFFETDFSQ